MKIKAEYSHLNGKEFLQVHNRKLLKEIKEVIKQVDAEKCKTKRSKEKTKLGKLLYSPNDMNVAFSRGFKSRGWNDHRSAFWVTEDPRLLRGIYNKTADEQKKEILEAGLAPIRSYNQIDFLKDRVAVEVQFGKYAFVAHDMFVKQLCFYVSDVIDVGVEVLPMKALEREMSSGVPYYERDLLNIIRQGRGLPPVPLILLGVEP